MNKRTLKRWMLRLLEAKRPSRARASRAERGMTLLEIMVVVVIIGLVSSVVGVQVFEQFTEASIQTTRNQMKNIADALELYRLHNRKYPSTGEGLSALTQSKGGSKPLLAKVPKDAWDNDFVYIYPGTRNSGSFDIMSYGPNEVQGGGDDIGNWDSPSE